MSRGQPVVDWTCDRCGHVVATSTDRPTGWRCLLVPQVTARTDLTGQRWLDICVGCDESFDDWLRKTEPRDV